MQYLIFLAVMYSVHYSIKTKKMLQYHKRQKSEEKALQTETKISPEELLAEGRTIQIKPQGYSMYPLFIPGRDSAVIAPPEKSGEQSANLRYPGV